MSSKQTNPQQLSMKSSGKEPEDFIMNPILAVHTQVDDLSIEVGELTDVTNRHTEQLSALLDINSHILKELQDRRPEGKVIRVNNTAPDIQTPTYPSGFFIIDTNISPGKKVRSYVVFNPGPNNLYVGFNAATSPQLDVSPEDIALDDKFDFLAPGQDTGDSFDTKEILSIHIRADPATGIGPQRFKAKLIY